MATKEKKSSNFGRKTNQVLHLSAAAFWLKRYDTNDPLFFGREQKTVFEISIDLRRYLLVNALFHSFKTLRKGLKI